MYLWHNEDTCCSMERMGNMWLESDGDSCLSVFCMKAIHWASVFASWSLIYVLCRMQGAFIFCLFFSMMKKFEWKIFMLPLARNFNQTSEHPRLQSRFLLYLSFQLFIHTNNLFMIYCNCALFLHCILFVYRKTNH